MKKLLTLFLVLFAWSAVAQTPQRERISNLDVVTSLKTPTTTDCATKTYVKVGDLCFDSDSDPDGDGTAGVLYQCGVVTGSPATCSSWETVAGAQINAANPQALYWNGTSIQGMAAIQSQASGNAVRFNGRYLEWDPNVDGTIDERWIGDFDGDGTQHFIKDYIETVGTVCRPGSTWTCTSGACALSGGTQRLSGIDLDSDGTLNDPSCGIFRALPGRWITTTDARWSNMDVSGFELDMRGVDLDYDDVTCSELLGKGTEIGLILINHQGATDDNLGPIEIHGLRAKGYGTRYELDAACYIEGGLNTCSGRFCPNGWSQVIYVLGNYSYPTRGKVNIYDNVLIDSDRMGIRCQGMNDCTVDGNQVDGAGEHGISVGHSLNARARNNWVRNSGQSGGPAGNGGDCIVTAGGMGTSGNASYNVLIEQNVCEDSATGVRFERPAGSTTPKEYSISITGNKCRNLSGACVGVAADAAADSLFTMVIDGNQSALGAQGGIDVEGNATLTLRGISITRNTFYDISSGATEYAIFGKYLQSSDISGNVVYDPNGRVGTGAAAGVINIENSDQIRVAGNIINGGDDAANNGHLIRLSTTTSSIIDGNILMSGADGSSVIDVANGNNNIIRGNRITMNATGSATMYGVQAWEDRTLVEGNFVTSTRNGAIAYRAEADYQTFANNMNELSGTGTTGLFIASTANNIYVNGGAFGQAGYAISEANSSSGPTYIQGGGKSTSAASFRYNLANVASYFMDAAMGNRIERSCADAAAAATMTADGCSWLRVTGAAAAITTMNTCNAANKGRILTIQCDDASATVIGGGGNMTFAAFTCDGATGTGDTVVMQCDGSVWTAIGKTVN